jgi:DNA-binding GntR family transcriptional regulator
VEGVARATVDMLSTTVYMLRALDYTEMLEKRNRPVASSRGDRSVRERAYLLIQQKIARGDLAPGSAVSEVALAQELGSSRTPIREALGQLVAEGLLDQTPNRGTVVVQLRRQDIIDLYELREALEVYAVGKVARQTNTPEDLQRLETLADEILRMKNELQKTPNSTLDEKQMGRFIASDLGFHTLLLRMAANARILKTVNETRLLMRIFSIHRRGHNAALLTKIHKHHHGILEAITEGNSARASELMSSHIQQSQRERVIEYDELEHESSMRDTLPVFINFHGPNDA